MRKNFLSLLAFYLDFLCADAAITLAYYFVGAAVENIIGFPLDWGWQVGIALTLAALLHGFGLSVGERLLAYAVAEREAGVTLRQWPNLVLGTLGLLSGLKELVRWTAPGTGMPFFLLVEETPFKIAAVTLFGASFGLGGIMLLTFWPRAKLFNAVFYGLGLVGAPLNYLFAYEATVAAQMTRKGNQGLPQTREQAEAIVNMSPWFGLAFVGAMLIVLYFCRERRG